MAISSPSLNTLYPSSLSVSSFHFKITALYDPLAFSKSGFLGGCFMPKSEWLPLCSSPLSLSLPSPPFIGLFGIGGFMSPKSLS